jgi:hypothetical protein
MFGLEGLNEVTFATLNNTSNFTNYIPTAFVYNWYDWTSLGVSLLFAVAISFGIIFYYSYKRRYPYGVYITLFITISMLFYMALMLTVDIAAVKKKINLTLEFKFVF